jgi:hypothetical protein
MRFDTGWGLVLDRLAIQEVSKECRSVGLDELGECLSALCLREMSALDTVRQSVKQHGQLSALTIFLLEGRLKIIDGFKRAHATRVLGLPTLLVRVDKVSLVEAKLHVSALSVRSGMTELKEGWLVWSLYPEGDVGLPKIGHLMGHHKSWVWCRLMRIRLGRGQRTRCATKQTG